MGWPIELMAEGAVSLGACAWRMGALPPHVSIVMVASLGYRVDGAVTRVDAGTLTRERGPAPVGKAAASSDLAPFLPETDVWLSGVAHGRAVRIAVGRDRALIDKTREVAGSVERAGFGLVPADAPARLALAGGVDAAGLNGALVMLPGGFDLRFFQAAPVDQRCAFLSGDEWVEVNGVDAAAAQVRVVLPGLRGEARLVGGARDVGIRMWIDGLYVDAVRRRIRVRWRGCVPVDALNEIGSTRVFGRVATKETCGRRTEAMTTAERDKLREELDAVRAGAKTVDLEEGRLAATVEAAPLLGDDGRDTLLLSLSGEARRFRRELGIPDPTAEGWDGVERWDKTVTLDDSE